MNAETISNLAARALVQDLIARRSGLAKEYLAAFQTIRSLPPGEALARSIILTDVIVVTMTTRRGSDSDAYPLSVFACQDIITGLGSICPGRSSCVYDLCSQASSTCWPRRNSNTLVSPPSTLFRVPPGTLFFYLTTSSQSSPLLVSLPHL